MQSIEVDFNRYGESNSVGRVPVTDADGSQRWEGVVDWSTRRDPMTRPYRYDASGSAPGPT